MESEAKEGFLISPRNVMAALGRSQLLQSERRCHRILRKFCLYPDLARTEFTATARGLLLNALFGLWWADPVAALIMTPIIAKEGIEGLQGKACNECRAE